MALKPSCKADPDSGCERSRSLRVVRARVTDGNCEWTVLSRRIRSMEYERLWLVESRAWDVERMVALWYTVATDMRVDI